MRYSFCWAYLVDRYYAFFVNVLKVASIECQELCCDERSSTDSTTWQHAFVSSSRLFCMFVFIWGHFRRLVLNIKSGAAIKEPCLTDSITWHYGVVLSSIHCVFLCELHTFLPNFDCQEIGYSVMKEPCSLLTVFTLKLIAVSVFSESATGKHCYRSMQEMNASFRPPPRAISHSITSLLCPSLELCD